MSFMTLRPRGGLRQRRSAWDLQDEFNRFFEDFGLRSAVAQEDFSPAMDIRETDEAYIVEADVPGIKREDVKIEVNDDVLTIKGERKVEQEENKKDYRRIERQYGSFRRSVSIPDGIQHDAVEAKFDDGVLRVTLPKREDTKPRRIEVNAN